MSIRHSVSLSPVHTGDSCRFRRLSIVAVSGDYNRRIRRQCGQGFTERIEYKLGVMVNRRLHGPRYLAGTSSQPLMLLRADVVYMICQQELSQCTVPRCQLSTYGCRHSTTSARQSGTRCQMNLEIRTVSIVLNGSSKQFSIAATSVTSALEVFW